MPLVMGYEEAKKRPMRREDQLAYFKFPDQPDLPHATLNGHKAGGYRLPPHYHVRDQFQVALDGTFTIGRHVLTPYCVHFSRAYTPYGPLVSDGPAFSFMVMRARRDAGIHKMPDSRPQLYQVPNRRPWQITQPVAFPAEESRARMGDSLLDAIPNLTDGRGLAGHTLVVKSNATAKAPDPSRSDGQYIVVVKGSFRHDGAEHKAIGLIFVKPTEGPYEIHAGPEGLEAIVLNFPEIEPPAPEHNAAS